MVVNTGQHDELFDTAAAALGVEVDVDLALMAPNQDLFHVGSAALRALRAHVLDFRPDIVLVQGDYRDQPFSVRLAGFFARAAVGTRGGGPAIGQKWAPYPEEIFRRLADVLTDLYFVAHRGCTRQPGARGCARGPRVCDRQYRRGRGAERSRGATT